MEAPREEETPAGAVAGMEGLDLGGELKASHEALTFLSSIGEFGITHGTGGGRGDGGTKGGRGGRETGGASSGSTWFWHLRSPQTVLWNNIIIVAASHKIQ